MKAIVTGGAGFVGEHLVEHLRRSGDTVVPLDRHHQDPDLLDSGRLRERVQAEAPDAVYHLGGWSDVGASWDSPLEAFRANAEGTLNLLQACRDLGARVLVVTSADVYGQVSLRQLPLTEDAPLMPITPYAASKIAADYLALQAWLGYGIETLRVRAFNHLGPGQSNHFVCPALAERIARNELEGHEIVRVGNLTPRRDFTDVRDVVRAYRLLLIDGEPGEAYNVCSGHDLPISELAERLVAMASRPMRLESDQDIQRDVEVPVLRGDFTKLHKATGWQPEIPIDQTLADVLDEWRDRIGP